MNNHLRSFQMLSTSTVHSDQFPFSVPAIASLAKGPITLSTPITFLIGENGSGKSTLLEALAYAIGSITVGSAPVDQDASLHQIRPLADALKLIWTAKTRRGFFMRSEDFFGYTKRLQQMRTELEHEKRVIAEDDSLSDLSRSLGQVPYARELAGLQRYGASLDAYSHGESFFKLFKTRFVPNGLYLLDEPEAPLSPLRQLAFIAMLMDMIATQNAQFIIATHSPILMAFPNATIYSFDGGMVQPIAYEQTEHYLITRDFLNDPQSFLRHLRD